MRRRKEERVDAEADEDAFGQIAKYEESERRDKDGIVAARTLTSVVSAMSTT